MYIFESRYPVEGVSKTILVIFSGQIESNEEDFSYVLEVEYRKHTAPDEIFIVLPSYILSKMPFLFEKTRFYDNAVRYGLEVPVTLVVFDVAGLFDVKPIHGDSEFVGQNSVLKKIIVDQGLLSLAEKRRDQIILKAPSGTIFIKPSRKEFAEFIKASELAVGYSENQFVAFCLLGLAPRGREIRRIFIDTNSISTYVENLLYYWVMFRGLPCKPAVYHSYGSYDGKDAAKPDVTEDVWLIISASRSNSMGISMAKEWGLVDDQVLTILSYKDAREGTLGERIMLNISSLSSYTLKEGERGSVIKVKVVGENFTAEVEKPTPVMIRRAHKTDAVKNWVRDMAESSMIMCNKIKLNTGLPFAVTLDPIDYFSTPDAKDWINWLISWHIPISTRWIVSRNNDPESQALCDVIKEQMLIAGMGNIQQVDWQDTKFVGGKDAAIIVVPVLTSGDELAKINRDLRFSGHEGNRIFIAPFVVFPNFELFRKMKDSLLFGPKGRKYSFYSKNEVFIGHSCEPSSWALELPVAEALGHRWDQRAKILRNLAAGLSGQIGTPSDSKAPQLTFSSDFAFWQGVYDVSKVRPEAVYLTIASILQGLRENQRFDDSTDSLFSHIYQHSVISPDNFERFNDGLLQSCLWRAAESRELDYRSSVELSRNFSDILQRLVGDAVDSAPNAAVDLMMGIATRKIQLAPEVLKPLLLESYHLFARSENYGQELCQWMLAEFFGYTDHMKTLDLPF